MPAGPDAGRPGGQFRRSERRRAAHPRLPAQPPAGQLNWENFARGAFKIWVDIDAAELKKPTVRPDLPVHADLAEVLPLLVRLSEGGDRERHGRWRGWCQDCRRRYRWSWPEYWRDDRPVNPYCFVERLFAQLGEDEVVVTGDGRLASRPSRRRVRRAMRLYHNSGCAPMGYDLPRGKVAAVALGGTAG